MIPSNSFLFFNPLRLQSLFRRTYIDFFDTLIPMILLTFLKHTVVFSSFFWNSDLFDPSRILKNEKVSVTFQDFLN